MNLIVMMMKFRLSLISIVLAALVLFSLFAVVSSPMSVSGQASRTTVPLDTSLVGGTMEGTGPAVSSGTNIHIFAVGSNGALWHNMIDGPNPRWFTIGGVCTSSPAAISSGITNVFVRGTDGALWWKFYPYDPPIPGQEGWSNWTSLGGVLASGTGPAVSSWANGRLDVFVQGTDQQLWHKSQNGSQWSNWEPLGGVLTSSPGTASRMSSTVDVFVRGTDGALWHKNWTSVAWSGWTSLGGVLASGTGPAACSNSTHSLNVFVQGTDQQLWQRSFNRTGVSTGWIALAGKPSEALSATSPAAATVSGTVTRTVGCVITTSGNVWYSTYPNWSQWTSAGSPP